MRWEEAAVQRSAHWLNVRGGHLWQCGKILMDVGIIMSHPPQHPGSTGICFVSSVGLRDDKMSNCVPGSSKKKMCTIYR